MSDTTDRKKYELYDIQSGPIVAFLGVVGFGGVLVYCKPSGWEFHPLGSTVWDNYHQAVYRNFRGDSLSESDLRERGIPLPPEEQFREHAAMDWKDNFTWEVPFGQTPSGCLTRMRRWPQNQGTLFIVLEEDEYETGLGDGQFLDLKAAFWDEASAKEYLEGKRRERAIFRKMGSCWYRHSLKEVRVSVDDAARKVSADPAIASYEHYGLDSILINLEKRKAWEESFNACVPMSRVPERVRRELRRNASCILYLIVYEDYDTAFTEESRHHLAAVFRKERAARKYLESREDEYEMNPADYRDPDRFWHMQDILVRIDGKHRQVTGYLVIDGYKGYSLEDILNMLAED